MTRFCSTIERNEHPRIALETRIKLDRLEARMLSLLHFAKGEGAPVCPEAAKGRRGDELLVALGPAPWLRPRRSTEFPARSAASQGDGRLWRPEQGVKN